MNFKILLTVLFSFQLMGTTSAFAKTDNSIEKKTPKEPIISELAIIGDDFKIDKWSTVKENVTIGDKVTIGKNVKVKRDTTIGNKTSISFDVKIGVNVTIGSNVKIGPKVVIKDNTVIGDNVVLGLGVLIGENVTIEHDVTIKNRSFVGNNSSIGNNTKLDFRVYVAENVYIGQKVIIGRLARINAECFLDSNISIEKSSVLPEGTTQVNDKTVNDDGSPRIINLRIKTPSDDIIIVIAAENFRVTTDGEVQLDYELEIQTQIGSVQLVDVSGTASFGGRGTAENDYVVSSFSADASVDLTRTTAFGDTLTLSGVTRFEVTYKFGPGSDVNQSSLPVHADHWYHQIELKVGLYGQVNGFDFETEVPVIGLQQFIVFNPDTHTYFLEVRAAGRMKKYLPVSRIALGVSVFDGIPYTPQSNFSFTDVYSFFSESPNYWGEIFPDDYTGATPIDFDGNLFFATTKKFTPFGLPIIVRGDVTIAGSPNQEYPKTLAVGINGDAFIGIKTESTDISLGLGNASVAIGATLGSVDVFEPYFAYVSGEAVPDVTFSPFDYNMELGTNVKVAGLLHSDDTENFLRLQGTVGVLGMELSGAVVELRKDQLFVGGKTQYGIAQQVFTGTIHKENGIDLKTTFDARVELVGTLNILGIVRDAAQCGYETAANGARCGWNYLSAKACRVARTIFPDHSCRTAVTCTFVPDCEGIQSQEYNYNFGSATVNVEVSLKGKDGLFQPSAEAHGEFCTTSNNCKNIDLDIIQVDLQNKKVCVDLSVVELPHVSDNICVKF